jgi:NTP pyrophosphatase (non-canonical NTP hydrolase)
MNLPTPLILTQTSDPEDFSGCPGANSYVSLISPDDLAIEQTRYDSFVALLFKQQPAHIMALHAALGVAGEAGELADAIKKEHIYGKPTDRANIVEELGDLRFYIQAVMQMYGISEQEVLQQNANKLCVRYKSLRYSDGEAIARADKSSD